MLYALTVRVFDIQWDADGEELENLPKETVLTLDYDDEEGVNLEECISDKLSEEYEFCHFGFQYSIEEKLPNTYCVSAIGYDKDDMVTDEERDFGNPTTLEEAKEQFRLVVSSPKEYLNEFSDMGYWWLQLEKCSVSESLIECTDVLDGVNIYKEDLA